MELNFFSVAEARTGLWCELNAKALKRRSRMLIFIAILAFGQAVLGVFRALQWFEVGASGIQGSGVTGRPRTNDEDFV